MTPDQFVDGVKLAAGFLTACLAITGILALAWLIWKRALFEAEKVVSATWERIATGYKAEVEQLRGEVGELRAKVIDLEDANDTYGCDNAPTCERRKPRRRTQMSSDPT